MFRIVTFCSGTRPGDLLPEGGPMGLPMKLAAKEIPRSRQGARRHFLTALENRRTMQTFVSHIARESEVWIADNPDHMIHFKGERFIGPYAL